ncbi:EthD family reductase [Microbacterium terrisoli]|uniref:EthD family reductase n=1 Tax=Microbacterium terrisoli TaxID=3242192 RepID=UPI002804A8CC|nr:EthD family reductase [Microbacterium protaetiae]
MFCASVVYPESDGLNVDYFATVHAPRFAEMIGENCVRWEVHRAVATPGAPTPPFAVAAYFWVESAETFGVMLAEHGEEIYADIANFATVQPTRGWAEVL